MRASSFCRMSSHSSVSVFDVFKIGIGPSSSHTVGPMRAAHKFQAMLAENKAEQAKIHKYQIHLYGSLALTGEGHGTPKALALGLSGLLPKNVDPSTVRSRLADIWGHKKVGNVNFGREDVVFHPEELLPLHSNGMKFIATDSSDNVIREELFYSIGGGFFVDGAGIKADDYLHEIGDTTHQGHVSPSVKYPYKNCNELLKYNLPWSIIAYENEKAFTPEHEIRPRLLEIWQVMTECIDRGVQTEGILPGGLNVVRRAPGIAANIRRDALLGRSAGSTDLLSLYSIAVNEENAAGSKVVTAPTNGAAGVIPAVLRYKLDKHHNPLDSREKTICDFLLTAGLIGGLYASNASISAAEVGCQGEIGVACSMAAGALAEVSGGNPQQVERAAEIGMEHNLGLSCDPVGGLVQVPCIERNVMGSVKAAAASRLALSGDGRGLISLDNVIQTMLETGKEMSHRYKETSLGGLSNLEHFREFMTKNKPEC